MNLQDHVNGAKGSEDIKQGDMKEEGVQGGSPSGGEFEEEEP